MDARQRLAAFIEKHTSQARFARDVDCSESHLSLVLNGQRGLSWPLAKRISQAAGIPADALMEMAPKDGERVA